MIFRQKSSFKQIVPAVSFHRCHAKTDENQRPGISVMEHLINVAEVCSALKEFLPERLKELGCFAVRVAAFHDVGKVSPGFQLKYFRAALERLIPEFKGMPISGFCQDHSHTGACALWGFWGKDDLEPPASILITATHHGAMKEHPLPGDQAEIFGGSDWSQERKLLIVEMEKIYGRPILENVSPVMKDFAGGMVTISDWIGSDETFFPPGQSITKDAAVKNARKAIRSCGLLPPNIIPDLSFEDIFGFLPYEVQNVFASRTQSPGVYVLEAPTGMGKTEAALFFAYKLLCSGQANGIFFGLPTRLTSDRIFHRVNEFLEKICADTLVPKLAHGTAWLSEYNLGGKELAPGNAWFSPRKRALLHPFVIGTLDQALMGILKVKHHFVRTFALGGKVVILDEVHSYDGYTGTLLDELVRALADLGCTIIILSATLTAQRRAAFFLDQTPVKNPEYPLISGPDFIHACPPPAEKQYQVSMESLDNEGVAKSAIESARQGNCVLCIANTVAKAQSWHDAIQSSMFQGEFQTGLLHSKFPGFQRAKIEDLWMDILGKKGQRPKGCILVATQVVEQSVDIDADFLITELAPTDMLLQRMGRQWRHVRNNRPCSSPKTIIVVGDVGAAVELEELYGALGESNCKVYSPWVLRQTWVVWKQRKNILLPHDVRDLLEQTYALPEEPQSQMKEQLYQEFKTMGQALSEKARGVLSSTGMMPTGEDKEYCATRYSDLPTTQLVLVKSLVNHTGKTVTMVLANDKEVEVNYWTHDFDITRQLHQNLITVPTYLLIRFAVSLESPEFLKKYFFDATPVMEWDEISGKIQIDAKKTDFHYSPQKGLFRMAEPSTNVDQTYKSDWEGIDIFDKARFDW